MEDRSGMNRRDFLCKATVAAALTAAPAVSGSWVAHAQTSATTASDQTMITIFFYFTVKEGNEQEAQDLFTRLAASTRAEDEGCLAYVIYQQQYNPREYVLFEQYRDKAALGAHLARLHAVYGPPRPNGQIPAAILDLLEEGARGVLYRVAA